MFQIFLNPAILEVMIVTLGSRALEYYNAKNEMRKRAELKQAGEAAEKERRRPTNPLLPLQSLLGGLGLTVGGEAQNANLNVQGVKLQLVKAQGVSVSCSEGAAAARVPQLPRDYAERGSATCVGGERDRHSPQ